jgi:hypothetical protein
MNKDILAIVRGYRDKGYTVAQSPGTSHYFVRYPDGSLYATLPSTPHARGVTESMNLLRRAPDLKAVQKAERKAAAAVALGAPVEERRLAPAEQIGDLPEVRYGKLPITAWWLWDHMRAEAERGGRPALHQDKNGYIWTGHISKAIHRLWPKIAETKTAVQREAVTTLPEYLRLTGHAATIRNRGPNALSEYWVSSVWAGGPETINKARGAGAQERHSGQHFETIKDVIRNLAGPEGIVTTRQIVAEVPDINQTSVSTILGEIVRSGFPLEKVKNGQYRYVGENMGAVTKEPTAARSSRRANLRLEVLRYKQNKPGTPESVAEVAAALDGAPETSVGRILREWWADGTQGIERLTGNLYVFRPHLLPEDHPLRNAPAARAEEPEPEPPAQESAPPAPVPAAPKATPKGHQRIIDLLASKPGARLFAEVFHQGDLVVVVDEEGNTYRAVKGE